MLTSREKPKEVAALEGEAFSVRSLQLSGLTTAQGRKIFRGKGNFYRLENDWQTLIQSYAGNPLALKIVATTIRNLCKGQCYQTLQGHSFWLCYVAFSPDGQVLASGSADYTIKLWDINTGQCLKTLQGHQDVVGFVTFIADGQTLISASEDETIKVWNVQTGQCKRTLPVRTALFG